MLCCSHCSWDNGGPPGPFFCQIDGSVVTWGAATYGGEAPEVPGEPVAIRSVRATEPWQQGGISTTWIHMLAHHGIYIYMYINQCVCVYAKL